MPEIAEPTLAEALESFDPEFAVEPVEEAAEEVVAETQEGHDAEPDDESTEEEVVEAEAEPEAEPDAPEDTDDADDEDASEPLTLSVSGAEGEDAIEVEIEVEGEAREALERLQARASMSDDLQASVDAFEHQREGIDSDMAALDEIELEIRTDPAGFVLSKLHPDTRIKVALELLQQDDVFVKVDETIADWARDPSRREVAKANAKADRVEQRDALKQTIAQQRESRSQAKRIVKAVNALIPTDMTAANARAFRSDATRDLTGYAGEHGTIDEKDVPEILARRLSLYGIEGITKQDTRAGARTRATTQRTGDRFKAQAARRKRASATAPASKGNIPSGKRPPKKASLEDAFKWADQNLSGV